MAIPLGFKNFVSGDVLTAGDTNGYLMQGLWTFADAAARDAAVTSPQEGNACYLKDTDVIQVYDGSLWVTKSGSTLVGCRLTKSANQSLANSTETAITFNGETWDTNTFHDNATNNTRITIPSGYTGKYQLSGEVSLESLTGQVYVLIKKNGVVHTYTVVMLASTSSGDTDFTFYQLIALTAADYVEMFIFQAGGGAKNCQVQTSFGINYIGA